MRDSFHSLSLSMNRILKQFSSLEPIIQWGLDWHRQGHNKRKYQVTSTDADAVCNIFLIRDAEENENILYTFLFSPKTGSWRRWSTRAIPTVWATSFTSPPCTFTAGSSHPCTTKRNTVVLRASRFHIVSEFLSPDGSASPLVVRSPFRAKHHVVVQYMARWMKCPLPLALPL